MFSTDRNSHETNAVQDYYHRLESRLGYKLLLGDRRHFGLYPTGSWWPFPVGKALRAMEDHLIANLSLPNESRVLDAGCGSGHVSIHLAKIYRMHGIDLVDHHIAKARENVKARALEGRITIHKGDYHHMDTFANNDFDGIFTMETFVHATNPEVAAANFFRVLKPGGSLALYEYDQIGADSRAKGCWTIINKYAAMPTNYEAGMIEQILKRVGFVDVVVEDLSSNVIPMLRLFYWLAFVPYQFISLLGLKRSFINTTAGYEGYLFRDSARYIAISARKPLEI